MEKTSQIRVLATALGLATLLICVLGALNFLQETNYEQPTDGVWWLESQNGLRAERVPADSPAHREGVRTGDVMVSANGRQTPTIAPLEREMAHSGTWNRIRYSLQRNGSPLDIQVILEPSDHSRNQGLRAIALVYLAIGLYVLFRRWTAPKATHFYLFCLVSGVLYAFRFTGQFDTLDWVVFWGNVLANALQPALFLHFAITFGEVRSSLRRRLTTALLYLPGLLTVLLQIRAITHWVATERLRHRLDQINVAYSAVFYVVAAAVFWRRYYNTGEVLERQQLKWLSRGTLLSVLPFTVLYAVPYLFDVPVSNTVSKAVSFCLIFLPLTFAWAIVRYRLMDTDLIFKRGVTYTLATGALVGVYFLIVAFAGEVAHSRLPSLKTWGILAVIVATALIFDPIKAAIQSRVDRFSTASATTTVKPSSNSAAACLRKPTWKHSPARWSSAWPRSCSWNVSYCSSRPAASGAPAKCSSWPRPTALRTRFSAQCRNKRPQHRSFSSMLRMRRVTCSLKSRVLCRTFLRMSRISPARWT